MVKYTFLLPAYKASYFEEALRSIKAQSYRDFKVQVSDDCSPEDLRSIFDRVCGDDPRFSYRRNAENLGGKSLVAHWNLLVDMCDTPWLIMASDDDVYAPRFLEEMDALQQRYPDVDLLRARVRNINDERETIAEDALYKEHVDELGFLYQKHFNNALRCIANYAFRTEVLRRKGGFVDFPLAWYSDDATAMMLAEHGAANTREMLFLFRSSTTSISSRSLSPKDAYKKASATVLFDKWFGQRMDEVKARAADSAFVRHQLRFIDYVHSHFMHEQFAYMSSHCTFADFRRLLKMHPTDNSARLLKNYLSAKLK